MVPSRQILSLISKVTRTQMGAMALRIEILGIATAKIETTVVETVEMTERETTTEAVIETRSVSLHPERTAETLRRRVPKEVMA